jgi:hypothetical protein
MDDTKLYLSSGVTNPGEESESDGEEEEEDEAPLWS